jgi:Ribonucleotide reductase, small chain
MTRRWSTLLLDEAALSDMARLPADAVLGHADAVAAARPTPAVLYRRADQQQWSAEAVSLGEDSHQWQHVLPRQLTERLRQFLLTFVIGEYTGLDLLGPIMSGCPDEESLVFLGVQVAEETRHTHLMRRYAEEILQIDGGLPNILTQAWREVSPAHRALSLLEARIVGDLQGRPSDYGRWVRAVTLFHLVTEGVLALNGQRGVVASLSRTRYLQGVKAGFTAMARDEARHVSYGLHALRLAVNEGRTADIADVVEQAAPLAVSIEVFPGAGSAQLRLSARTGADLVSSLSRRLRQIGLSDTFVRHVDRQATNALRDRLRAAGHDTDPSRD